MAVTTRVLLISSQLASAKPTVGLLSRICFFGLLVANTRSLAIDHKLLGTVNCCRHSLLMMGPISVDTCNSLITKPQR
ncbi:hypothetical protein F4782DRAFT_93102 [Xylaria castorea]|nr:hypothetical protein F4782DRAFT_93102 [Xylaria castorea]